MNGAQGIHVLTLTIRSLGGGDPKRIDYFGQFHTLLAFRSDGRRLGWGPTRNTETACSGSEQAPAAGFRSPRHWRSHITQMMPGTPRERTTALQPDTRAALNGVRPWRWTDSTRRTVVATESASREGEIRHFARVAETLLPLKGAAGFPGARLLIERRQGTQ